MMKLLLSMCLLFVLLCPVTALECQGCRSVLFVCIDTKKQICKAGQDTCYNSNLKSNIFSLNRFTMKRLFGLGCTKSQDCYAGDFSFTSPKKYFQLISECCHTTMCNPKIISLPVREPNGYQCEIDRSINPENPTVACHNNETKCIHFAGAIKKPGIGEPKVNFQGCATQDFCDWAEKSPTTMINLITLDIKQVNCSDASPSSDQVNPLVG